MIVPSNASRLHLRRPARRVLLVAALLASALPTVAHAQSQGEVIAELRAQLESLRVEQARSNQRIAELETTLEKVAATQASAPPFSRTRLESKFL